MSDAGGAYDALFLGSSIYLAVTMFLCLIRAIIGPRLTDRLVAVNIISCKVVILFAVLAVYMEEFYLLDVCLTYALISFLAVVVLSKAYMPENGMAAVPRAARAGRGPDGREAGRP